MYWHEVAGKDIPFLHRGSRVNAAVATKQNRALDTDDWNMLKNSLPSVSICVRLLKKLIQSFEVTGNFHSRAISKQPNGKKK